MNFKDCFLGNMKKYSQFSLDFHNKIDDGCRVVMQGDDGCRVDTHHIKSFKIGATRLSPPPFFMTDYDREFDAD